MERVARCAENGTGCRLDADDAARLQALLELGEADVMAGHLDEDDAAEAATSGAESGCRVRARRETLWSVA